LKNIYVDQYRSIYSRVSKENTELYITRYIDRKP